jgi:iron complex outermembrane receptor protein
VVVEGATADRNPDGSPRLVVGRSSLDHKRQNLAKFVLGFAPTDALSARLTLADWRNDSDIHAETLLHDGDGAPVYDATIDVGGRTHRISNGAFSPRRSREEHRLLGLELGGRIGAGWHWDATASRYDFATSRDREATLPPPQAATGGPGTIADADGSGWQTADLRATGPLGTTHQLDMGLHADRYVLDTRVHDAGDWRGAPAALARAFGGRSRTDAAYVQDEWTFATDWTATLGLRAERWRAYQGRRADAGTELAYPSRSRNALSPKAALAWTFADAWQVRASLGRAVRFPTVGELFQGSISAGAIVNGNPDLEPERDLAMDLSLEHAIERGRWRVSLFHHDLRDSLYTQTDVSVTPTVTNVQNIGRGRLAGIDAEFERRDVGIDGLDVYASIAFNRSRTLEDRQFPAAEGRDFPRMPRTRASVQVDWRFADGWNASLGGRHSGRQYGTLDNRDFVDTFGAVSSYTVFDAKLRFRPAPEWTASLGVDNLTDERYWVYHPWPGRTWYAELRWNSG